MTNIAVIGDVILDKYTFGNVERISPEAPIPILYITEEVYKPGGAGNSAANLATLGANVDLFGIAGKDSNYPILKRALEMHGINNKIISDSQRPTIIKQRLIASGQQLLRADNESSDILKDHHLNEIKQKFNKHYDAILISDYAKGMVCDELMNFLRNKNIPIFIDPKPKNSLLYKGCYLVTPNIKECKEISRLEDDLEGAKKISKDLETNVLLTRSEKGIALINKDVKSPCLFEAEVHEVKDVTGAGDTVIATMVYFYTQGKSLEESAKIANQAAGISVGKVGCYQVKLEDLVL